MALATRCSHALPPLASAVLDAVPGDAHEKWTKMAEIKGDAPGDRAGQDVSLSRDGTVVALRLPGYKERGNETLGSVRIFELKDKQWTERGEQFTGRHDHNHGSDLTVSLSGDGSVVAYGLPHATHNGNKRAGAVHIFHWNGTSWEERGAGLGGDFAYQYAGQSISMSHDGSVIAFGVPSTDDGGQLWWRGRWWPAADPNEAVDNATEAFAASDAPNWHDAWNKANTATAEAPDAVAGEMVGAAVAGKAAGAGVADGSKLDAPQCPTCGKNPSTSALNCCSAGGSWEGTCSISGGEHTFTEGFYACQPAAAAAATSHFQSMRRMQDNATAERPARRAGCVHVYKWTGNFWKLRPNPASLHTPAGDLVMPTVSTGQAVSLSDDGDTVAYGEPFYSSQFNPNVGAVRMVKWDGHAWKQHEKLVGDSACKNAGSLISLSGSGSVVAFGGGGCLVAYEKGGKNSTWQKRGDQLVDTQDPKFDGAGKFSIALSRDGDTLAYLVPHNQLNAAGHGNWSSPGAVRVYLWSGENWTKKGEIVGSEPNGMLWQATNLLSWDSIPPPNRPHPARPPMHPPAHSFCADASSRSGGGIALSADGGRIAIGFTQEARNSGEGPDYNYNCYRQYAYDDEEASAPSTPSSLSSVTSFRAAHLERADWDCGTGDGPGVVRFYDWAQ